MWSKNLISIMRSIERTENWGSRLVVSIDSAQKALMCMYEQVWHDEVLSKAKLCTYRLMKQTFETESHLKVNVPKWKHGLMSQLRCGVLPLELETARFKGLPPEECTCRLCNKEPETELHFLFDCPELGLIHSNLFATVPKLIDVCNNVDKLKILINMPHVLTTYIGNLWQQQNDILCG